MPLCVAQDASWRSGSSLREGPPAELLRSPSLQLFQDVVDTWLDADNDKHQTDSQIALSRLSCGVMPSSKRTRLCTIQRLRAAAEKAR